MPLSMWVCEASSWLLVNGGIQGMRHVAFIHCAPLYKAKRYNNNNNSKTTRSRASRSLHRISCHNCTQTHTHAHTHNSLIMHFMENNFIIRGVVLMKWLEIAAFDNVRTKWKAEKYAPLWTPYVDSNKQQFTLVTVARVVCVWTRASASGVAIILWVIQLYSYCTPEKDNANAPPVWLAEGSRLKGKCFCRQCMKSVARGWLAGRRYVYTFSSIAIYEMILCIYGDLCKYYCLMPHTSANFICNTARKCGRQIVCGKWQSQYVCVLMHNYDSRKSLCQYLRNLFEIYAVKRNKNELSTKC